MNTDFFFKCYVYRLRITGKTYQGQIIVSSNGDIHVPEQGNTLFKMLQESRLEERKGRREETPKRSGESLETQPQTICSFSMGLSLVTELVAIYPATTSYMLNL